MSKRYMRPIGVVIVLSVLLIAVLSIPRLVTHASSSLGKQAVNVLSTINGLSHISMVGSTEFIVDAGGHTADEDANPYDVAVAPNTASTRVAGNLKTGDLIVTNIGGNDTGTTLIAFPQQKGPGHLFNKTPNAATSGPADESFNVTTGTDWVSNVNANDVEIFNPNGSLLETLKNPLFDHPWGAASNQNKPNGLDKSSGSFFVANTKNATIDRIDIIPGAKGATFKVFQIGQLTMGGDETKIGLTWVPSVTIAGKKFQDVLLAIDTAANRIAAYPNSTTLNTSATKSTSKGMTAFQGKPLNMPGGFSINPLNGDLLVVNLNDNNLVELNLNTKKVIGIKLIDNVPVDLVTGNGSALFGVLALKDARGNLEVYFTDDNTNTLDLLSV